MNAFLVDLIAGICIYAKTASHYAALEALAHLREIIARAEQFHRSRIIRDPLDDDDSL